MINNNIVSEYLSSSENLYSSINLNDAIEIFDSNTTIHDESIFLTSKDNENENENQIQYFISFATGKDSIAEEDEISKLFSNFSKNNEF